MSDKDRAQMNAITSVFVLTKLYLCWWHVLRAWWQNFNTIAHADVWALMRRWIRMTSPAEFESTWVKIQEIAPPSVVQYLKENWMGEQELWSAVYRTDRNVYQLCDTNMLAEAWHRFLKHHVMAGKHGRRLDQLVHLLTGVAIPYFKHRHLRQALGFAGADVAQKALDDALQRGAAIKAQDVIAVSAEDGDLYDVRSQSDPTKKYRVHIGTPMHCACPSFPRILYCKHVHAAAVTHAPHLARTSTFCPDYVPTEYEKPCDIDDEDDDQLRSPQPPPLLSPTTTTSPPDNALRRRLIAGIAWLSCRLQSGPPFEPSDAVAALADAIDRAIGDVQRFDEEDRQEPLAPLPPKKVVAPRQHHETLTAAAMGQPRKGADKRKANAEEKALARSKCEPRPFRAGESSGKKAKADALGLPANTSAHFDAPSFELQHDTALTSLKKPQLEQLLALHGLKKSGTNAQQVERLRAHRQCCACARPATSPQRSGPAPPSVALCTVPTTPSFTFYYPPVPPPVPPPSNPSVQHIYYSPSSAPLASVYNYNYPTYYYYPQQ
ncbi:hypothetical protein K523DRAFT_317383 [Schizophyllum commune Tattone D]|nr:hypothetical protein K523DRAFT_317383 [Schizophyllum commune Tattone D]